MSQIPDDELIAKFVSAAPLHFSKNAVFVKAENAFYLWEDGAYRHVPDQEIMQAIWDFLKQAKAADTLYRGFNICQKRVESLLFGLRLDHKRTQESSLTHFVSFNDSKALNLNDFSLSEATPEIPSFFKLNISSKILDEKPTCPRFQQFLGEVLVQEDGKTPDLELIGFAQEIFGYCLTGSIAAHATFFFFGSGRNGKSVLLDVLRSLVGERYIANMTIQTLTTRQFSASNLIGKKINIASEEESKHIQSDLFKSLVAGDPVTVEKKYRDPFELRPSVKFLFATNQIPIFDSTDPAIRDRVLIVPFFRYFNENERDRELKTKLQEEIGGIFAWALEGAKRIVERKYKFIVPTTVRAMGERFEKEQSSVLTFVNENYLVTGGDEYVVKAVMYEKYKEWCDINKRTPKMSENFFKDLNNVHRGKVTTDARRSIGGKETRVVLGVRETDDDSAFIHIGKPPQTEPF
jgi:putative DNA primase/helicase